MEAYDRKMITKEAFDALEDSKYYNEESLMQFVLFKKGKFIIGFTYPFDERIYLYQPFAPKKKYLKENRIHYSSEVYQELFEECIEGYILQQLSKGYELVYMTYETHVGMWNFIDGYIQEMENVEEDVFNYLKFCFETGINKKTIEETQLFDYEDLFKVFMEHSSENTSVIISNTIGEKVISLEEPLNSPYAVRIFNKETYEVELFKEYADKNEAVPDYIQLFQEMLVNFTCKLSQEFEKNMNNFGIQG